MYVHGGFRCQERREGLYVNDEPSFSNHILEGVIHELLEHCRGVSEFEEHYGWFKECFVGDKGSFPLVAVFDADVVVTPADVKLGE